MCNFLPWTCWHCDCNPHPLQTCHLIIQVGVSGLDSLEFSWRDGASWEVFRSLGTCVWRVLRDPPFLFWSFTFWLWGKCLAVLTLALLPIAHADYWNCCLLILLLPGLERPSIHSFAHLDLILIFASPCPCNLALALQPRAAAPRLSKDLQLITWVSKIEILTKEPMLLLARAVEERGGGIQQMAAAGAPIPCEFSVT